MIDTSQKDVESYVFCRFCQMVPTKVTPPSEEDGVSYKVSVSSSQVRYSQREASDDAAGVAGTLVRSYLQHPNGTAQLKQLSEQLDSCLELSFVDMLIRHINEKGWRDSQVYKAAQLDRRLFSKIMSDRQYKPSKDTALALIIALELPLSQATDLLSRAGYVLSFCSKRDVIIEYFIREGIYDLSDINAVLYHLGQKLIGR